jgi:5-methylcytosine-specific restriction endonuclease McrA
MRNKSGELYKGQRNKEKFELFKRFRHPAIADVYKNIFFSLFDHECFKCGASEKLDIDHHIPMILGGHLVVGNLVALCKQCNNKKHDRPPEEFYTPEELKKLKPLLDRQRDIFDFSFDWDFWNRDRQGYLISLGVEPNLVHELLNNPDHNNYIAPQMPGFEIAIDLSDVLKTVDQADSVNSKMSK